MSAKVLIKTSDLSRADWLRYRTMGIGGSDVSVIAGINPYRSVYQLWLEKTGQTKPAESDNEYTHFGTILEPVVRKEFTARTGLKVRQKHMLLQSEEYPFMIANLDGVINLDGEMCIFEAKTASAYKLDDWQNGIPPEYNNYNNHPFVGHTAEGDFALCHNGVLFNYDHVKKNEQLPKSKIKTDSYVAVQLIEKCGKADFENIGKMSEIVNGSFVFTVLTSEEKLYISRWDNPICLLHFPKLGIYVYTSTKEIMQMALKGTLFEKQPFETIEVTEGEMISIDKQGSIERNRFVPEYDVFFGYYGIYDGFRERDDYDSYLCEYGSMFGVSEEEIMMLYDMGYDDEEIELMMMDHDMLRDCLNEAKEMIGIYM